MKWISLSARSLCLPTLGFWVKGMPIALAYAGGLPPPTIQDVQIIGRVMSFREGAAAGSALVAIVYNDSDTQSYSEAQSLVGLLGDGRKIGGLVLSPILVEQGNLAATGSYNAVLATAGVSADLLRAALIRQKVPCITRHIEQVSHGACIVGIRTSPSVSITYSSSNADAAGVRFATAFVMMVRGL